jgi:hypothetical protein
LPFICNIYSIFSTLLETTTIHWIKHFMIVYYHSEDALQSLHLEFFFRLHQKFIRTSSPVPFLGLIIMVFAGCCCRSPGPECSEIFVELRTSFPLLGNYLILTMALIILQTSLRACFVWRFHFPPKYEFFRL